MGAFADAVRDRLRDGLRERLPGLDWTAEYRVRRTPVDVVGVADPPTDGGSRFVAVELEWRRADPVNNAAKLFYHADDGALDGYDEVLVCQAFSGYYDLESGGVSSKREVAEFVGRTAESSVGRVSYRPLTLAVDPPKRGGERPDGWRDAVATVAGEVVAVV